jgi:predicted MFS family arabinose efflux permease
MDLHGACSGRGVHSAIMSLCGSALLAAVLALPRLPGSPAVAAHGHSGLIPELKSYLTAIRLLRLPAIALAVLTKFIRISAESIPVTFYAVFLSHAGLSGWAIGILLSIGALIGSPVALLAHSTIEFCSSRRRAILLSVTVALMCISITPLILNFALLCGAMVLFGVSMGINQPILLSVLSSAVGYEHQGLSMGLRSTASRLAAVVVPSAFGVISAQVGLRHGFYLTGSFLLIMTLLLAIVTRDAVIE